MSQIKLAIVVSHPIQYYSPWFRYLANELHRAINLRVFYLWDFGVNARHDVGFGHALKWDIPLLDGYNYHFSRNSSSSPGTHHYCGLINPELELEIAHWQPDVILMYGYRYWSHQRVMRSPRLKHVPIVFRGDSHELVPRTGLKDQVARYLRRRWFRRFSAALAVGTANETYLRDSGISQSKIFFAPHSVDNDRYKDASNQTDELRREFLQRLGISPTNFVFLFVGKLEEKKRPLDLLAAFSVVKTRTDRPCSLVFVGAGPQKPAVEKEVLQRGISDVHFVPFQNQSQMPGTYAAGNLLVLPSYGSGETWGLVVNEAMCVGLPIIVSSHVGCGPNLVQHGRNGWIFPAGDREGLAKSMIAALSQPDDCAEMGRQSRQIIAGYNYATTTAGLVRALESILRTTLCNT